MRILVLDGNENQAVASVRSLARTGHPVSVGAETSWSKAGWSRHADASFRYPSPCEAAGDFVERIAEEASREPGTLVLPMTERTTLPLSANRETIFAAGGRLVLPPHSTVLRAFDKQRTTSLAASLGISVPRTEFIESEQQARVAAAQIRYPVVLKPRSSEQLSRAGSVITGGPPLYARDQMEFIRAYQRINERSSSVLAQEFVEGEGAGYFALMRNGELRAEFAHRRIRDVRPTGSGSSVRVSVAPDPAVRQAALAVLRELRWHGVAMVEFRVRQDGMPVFLEVNGRFWNSLPLAVYAGADFPALLAAMAFNGDVEPPASYLLGVRCRWLVGDFRHLLEVWKGAPASYPGEFPGRLRSTAAFLAARRGTFHDNFTVKDPLPELADWLDFALRRLPTGLSKLIPRRGKRDARALNPRLAGLRVHAVRGPQSEA